MALPARLAAGRRLLPTLFVLMATAPALAQAPAGGAPAQEAPKNLKVLPKDWTRAQVVAVMQNFNAGARRRLRLLPRAKPGHAARFRL